MIKKSLQRESRRALAANANFIRRELARIDISGIWPPIPTPFKHYGRGYTDAGVDYDSLQQNLQKWKTKGFKGITVQGSNGSYPYLSPSERIELVERLNDMLAEIANDQDDKMLLMAGAGAESTGETLKITEAMCLADADVLLVVTPSFYKNAMKPSVLVKHFSTIADFSDKPIIIYNVPANTGLDMPAEAIADLADHPNICGVKDSGGDIAKIGHLLWLTEGKHFQVLAGSASFLHPAVQLGASGGVCALANVLGSEVVRLYNLSIQGDNERAALLQKRLIHPNQIVTKIYGVPGLKHVMGNFGYATGHLRPPLANIELHEMEKAMHAFTAAGFHAPPQ